MSKSVTALLLVVVLLFSVHYAIAEDLSSMTDEELLSLRKQINEELAARSEQSVLQDGMTLAEIFPDKNLAIYIRDEVGAFSINDHVTQDDLDRVTNIQISGKETNISSLEGIQYLTNMTLLNIYDQNGQMFIPDCFDALPNLTSIMFRYCDITELPPSIVNAPALRQLNIKNTDISSLPEDIGNLSTLRILDISNTKITSLPASIRLLDLEEFKREGLNLGD